MAENDKRSNVLATTGVVLGAVALIPALVFLSHLNDDSAVRAKAKAERMAAEEEKNRLIMYEELNRRLGNR